MDENGEPLQLPFTVNDYEFIRFIGSGTYSAVFEVQSLRYRQQFCAKTTQIDPDMLDEHGRVAYDAELLCLQSLDHPNIMRLYDHFVWNDNLVLILEKCDGGTLVNIIEDQASNWTMHQIRNLMINVISGLMCCITRDIAHRDIKPSNIMIDRYHRAKVGDFGLSHYAPKSELTDVRCGSGNYAAPEIFGEDKYDPYAADIWSLGVTFFQVVFKKLPWSEDTEPEDRRISDVVFPDSADMLFVDLIRAMLDMNPMMRPTLEAVSNHPFFKTQMKDEQVFRKKTEPLQATKRNIISLATGSRMLSVSTKTNKPAPSIRSPVRKGLGVRNLTFDTF